MKTLLPLLAAIFCSAIAQAAAASSTLFFPSGGSKIAVDHYPSALAGRRPAVVVLHGAGGTWLDGPEMRRLARFLAAAGADVYLVHYFNRTGTLFAHDPAMQRNFQTWLATVRDAIRWVQMERRDPAPIGLYGYSLGAFLSLAAASDNPRVGAVVEQAGGMWNGNEKLIGEMPPVLVVHGLADQRVPFKKYAKPLVAVLRRRQTDFRTRFVAGEGHGFTPSAMMMVRKQARDFFAGKIAASLTNRL
jgi:carboxymethylenebutenolidase